MTDFAPAEYQARCEKAQILMQAAGLDALFFCTEPEVRYFTGFRTLFWQSPTRPWYVVLPAKGKPIAVIPQIGADLMASTWVEDIRTWSSPHPTDDGISLLTVALKPFDTIGLPMSEEASLRMPPADYATLVSQFRFVDCSPLVKQLRTVKSPAEVAVIRQICAVASAAFDRVPDIFADGDSLAGLFSKFKIELLHQGAEDVPYLVGGSGQGGYTDVISPPHKRALVSGDVVMMDTGSTISGYFCDFDRNFAIGAASTEAKAGYRQLWQATEAGLQAARPGARFADLFHAMHTELGGGSSDVGRYGHGFGTQLTEYPSIAPFDTTELVEGMVITLEPSLALPGGKMMVHEENMVITANGPELLTKRAAPELPEV